MKARSFWKRKCQQVADATAWQGRPDRNAAVAGGSLESTDGVTVRLVRLIETLAVEAIRSGSERIDQNSLVNMTNSPLLSMVEDAGVPV
jgi:hypothetical protein